MNVGALVFYLDAIIGVRSSLVNRFFLAACGEVRRLAELFLWACRTVFPVFIFLSKLCVGVMNSMLLFISCVGSRIFQCKCRLFCVLRALVSISM